MRKSHPQSLDQLFDNTTSLKYIQQRAVMLLKLTLAVKSILPRDLQPHCRVANLRNNKLIIEVPNANWLMLLRYEQMKLLTTLRSDILPSLIAIDIMINPSFINSNKLRSINNPSTSNSTSQQTRYLSMETAQHLRELAKRCPKQLQIKLERLASLAEENTKNTNRNK